MSKWLRDSVHNCSHYRESAEELSKFFEANILHDVARRGKKSQEIAKNKAETKKRREAVLRRQRQKAAESLSRAQAKAKKKNKINKKQSTSSTITRASSAPAETVLSDDDDFADDPLTFAKQLQQTFQRSSSLPEKRTDLRKKTKKRKKLQEPEATSVRQASKPAPEQDLRVQHWLNLPSQVWSLVLCCVFVFRRCLWSCVWFLALRMGHRFVFCHTLCTWFWFP